MAHVGEMEEGGTGAADGQGGVSNAQSVSNTGTNALAAGGTGGGGGAPVGSVLAFSAEQVKAAIVAAEADLADGLRKVTDELLGKQARLLNDFLPKYAISIATRLAASVQVICCCVHAWCKLRVCVCRDACIVASVHCSICCLLLHIAGYCCMFACSCMFLLVPACSCMLHVPA